VKLGLFFPSLPVTPSPVSILEQAPFVIAQVESRAIDIYRTLINVQAREQIRPVRTDHVDIRRKDIRADIWRGADKVAH
jgi:hypothetical protein